MIFEDPSNPAEPTLKTTATTHTVTIYKEAKWIEFIPTALLTKSVTQTLNVLDLKNMPYMVPAGINLNLYLWIDTGIRAAIEYDAKPTAPVSEIFYKELNPIPSPALVSQPNSFELIFQPFNKIPKTGKIVLNFPNYDWTFTDAYCQITSGLTDSACDILALSKEIIIQDWLNDYDPIVDGKINLKFDIINPSTA